MIGAGHIQDMINRIKQNRDLQHSRHHKFENPYKKGGSKNKFFKEEFNFPKPSASKMTKIKARIKAEGIREKRKELLISLVAFLIVALLFSYLFFF